MSVLLLKDFGIRRGQFDVLTGVSLTVTEGEVIGLIGPNGAGKTSLMRGALGLIPSTGHSSVLQMPARARGRAVAWLPQAREIAWPISVERLVMLGRTPYLATGQKPTQEDERAVQTALSRLDLASFRNRAASQLSGGEQARVLLARALAQDTPLLMADEPIAGLDPAYQIYTMNTFADLARDGRSIVVSLHDLGLAARYCTRLIVIDRGRIAADGLPADVLSPDLLRDTFGITAVVQNTQKGVLFQAVGTTR